MKDARNSNPTRLDPDAPLAVRLAQALLFPLQGAALAAVIGLSLSLIVAGMVPVLGWLLQLVVWAASFKYALDVLEAAAHGSAEAPEIALTDNGAGGSLLLLAHMLALLCIVLASVLHVTALWWPPFVLAVAMPAATMSLALGDGQLYACLTPTRNAPVEENSNSLPTERLESPSTVRPAQRRGFAGGQYPKYQLADTGVGQ